MATSATGAPPPHPDLASNRAQLIEAGWNPDGGRSIAEAEAALTGAGYDVTDAMRAVLGQVVGLAFTRPALPPKRKPRTFDIDVVAAVARTHESQTDTLGVEAADAVAPIGGINRDELLIVVGTDGRLYAGKYSPLYLLGDSLEAALDRLVSQVPVAQWPVVTRPETPGWPIVLHADPPHLVDDAVEAARLASIAEVHSSGPVIGVSDLGTVWRVFRSLTADLMERPLVALLVDRETGNVHADWPVLDLGPTAQDGFAELLAAADTDLRARGFTGRRNHWTISGPDGHTTVLHLERRPSHSNRASLDFALSVHRDDGSRDVGLEQVRCGGVRTRFFVLAGVDPRPMAELLVRAIDTFVLPRVQGVQDPPDHLTQSIPDQ